MNAVRRVGCYRCGQWFVGHVPEDHPCTAILRADGQRVLIALLEHRVDILEKRLRHSEIELAQARASRDDYQRNLGALLTALNNEGIEVVEPEPSNG